MLSSIIVEDELRGRETLKNLVHTYCPEVVVVDTASSVEEGAVKVTRIQPDIVFLDISLGAGTGFDLLKKIDQLNFDVIFTTAHEHYALQAIKFSAIDYLLKPIDLDDLQVAVAKVIAKKNQYDRRLETLLNNLRNQHNQQHTITLSTQEGLFFVPVTDIIRLEAMGSYTYFILRDGRKIMVSKHLKEYEHLLRPHSFFRVHQSHIVNTTEVVSFVKSDNAYVVLKDQTRISLASRRKEDFLQHMQQQN